MKGNFQWRNAESQKKQIGWETMKDLETKLSEEGK